MQDQPSFTFLAALANVAIKQTLSAASNSLASVSEASILGGILVHPSRLSQLDSEASSLAASEAKFWPLSKG